MESLITPQHIKGTNMPIYNFRCNDCLVEEEVLLPVGERNIPRIHSCGVVMERLMSIPLPPIMVLTGNDQILQTLNKEGDYPDFLGGRAPQHRPRYEQAMARSLDLPKKVIGKGF